MVLEGATFFPQCQNTLEGARLVDDPSAADFVIETIIDLGRGNNLSVVVFQNPTLGLVSEFLLKRLRHYCCACGFCFHVKVF